MAAGDILERLVATVQTAAANIIVRSALNPMIWMSAVVGFPCLVLAYLVRGTEPLETVLICLGAGTVAATVLGFFYFMLFAPERLQSEEYQLRHETLELIKEKGSALEISPASLESITNPRRVLSRGGKK